MLVSIVTEALVEHFHIRQGYWAIISAVAVTQQDHKSTILSSAYRFIATGVGCLFAISSIFLLHHNILPNRMSALIFVSALSSIAIVIDNRLRVIAPTSIIVLMSSASNNPLHTAQLRVLNILLGITVSAIVTILYVLVKQIIITPLTKKYAKKHRLKNNQDI